MKRSRRKNPCLPCMLALNPPRKVKTILKTLAVMGVGYLFWKALTPRVSSGVVAARTGPAPSTSIMGLYDAPIGVNYGGAPLEEGQQNLLVAAGLQEGLLAIKTGSGGEYKTYMFTGDGQDMDFAQAASFVQQRRGWF